MIWLEQIRARIAPWKLLQQQLQDIANRVSSYGVEELEEGVRRLVPTNVAAIPSSFSTNKAGERWTDGLRKLPEHLEKLKVVDQLTNHGTAGAGSAATMVKLVTCVDQVAETAQFVADLSKSIAGVGTIFNLVALRAKGVSRCAEASRGRRELPAALGRLVILLRYVLKSLMEVMMPSKSVDEFDKDFTFEILSEIVSTIDMAETQLLRGWAGQVRKAESVKEVEQKIKELEQRVMISRNISRVCVLSRKLQRLEEEPEIYVDGLHHVRPSAHHSLLDVRENWTF